MSTPAFIYATDNLGPEKFTALCGLLLATRFKGFLLGGVGADGGVDGEVDETLGSWLPETVSPLLNEIIFPNQRVVFQFKHKVTARVGQVQSRSQLLGLYRCTNNKKCEIHRNLIIKHNPAAYVLVTNVEVNSEFRATFINQCRQENGNIAQYQIIGLVELETWVSMEAELRHLYFPTIFGPPRFQLSIKLTPGTVVIPQQYMGAKPRTFEVLQVAVLNVGLVPSYVSGLAIKAIVDGTTMFLHLLNLGDKFLESVNPKSGTPVEPGRRPIFTLPLNISNLLKGQGTSVFPTEMIVIDEIGNQYSCPIEEELRKKLLS